MDISKDQIKRFNEKSNLKNTIRGGQQEGKNHVVDLIIAQDNYKQQVIDGLLEIRRKLVTIENDQGQPAYLQEFVRLEDGSGQWLPVDQIPEEKWNEIKEGGVVNEKGAKRVLTHLNAVSNENIIFGNLSQSQINNIGLNAANAIDSLLRSNMDKFEIDSVEQIEWIMDSMVNPNQLTSLSKSKNGKMIGETLRNINLVGSLDDEEDDESGGLLARYG